MDRRTFLAATAAPLGFALAIRASVALGEPSGSLRVRHRVRHRIRRRADVRTVSGRTVWVVPVRLTPGWELLHAERVVVVREIRAVGQGGSRTEVAVVEHTDGATAEIEIAREDTPENSVNLAGSAHDGNDFTTPALEDPPRD
jgi:hypothetical protein